MSIGMTSERVGGVRDLLRYPVRERGLVVGTEREKLVWPRDLVYCALDDRTTDPDATPHAGVERVARSTRAARHVHGGARPAPHKTHVTGACSALLLRAEVPVKVPGGDALAQRHFSPF